MAKEPDEKAGEKIGRPCMYCGVHGGHKPVFRSFIVRCPVEITERLDEIKRLGKFKSRNNLINELVLEFVEKWEKEQSKSENLKRERAKRKPK